MAKVLIVEDEKAIVDIIAFNLKREGYEIEEAYDGEEGLRKSLLEDVDLVLLDVMLPLLDGFEVLRRVREQSNVPVIMVTAREEERDKILGLESGADDYITKPFSVKELSARVKANIRRRMADSGKAPGRTGRSGPFEVDYELRTATKNGRTLELSQRNMICSAISSRRRAASSPGKS